MTIETIKSICTSLLVSKAYTSLLNYLAIAMYFTGVAMLQATKILRSN